MAQHSFIGRSAKDRITGFEGLITGHAEYLTGCDQFLLQPRVSDAGKLPDSCWFDEQRLDVEQDIEPMTLDNSKGVGACGEAPKK